ncbi:MAG: TRAP transporter substrate-binding protein [Bacillota bacterium]
MKKRFILLVLLLIGFMVLVVGCGENKTKPQDTNGKKQVALKLGHVTQTSHPYHIAALAFKEKVESATDGRISIEIYPARQLGGDRDMLEQIQNGSLDMGLISSAIFSGFTPLLDGLQLPFLMENYDVLHKAVKTDEAKALLAGLEEINVKGLAFYDAGFRHFVTVNKPINEPSDLRGVKLRVVESPLMLDIFNTLGASPTPMPYGEIYSALQTGVIDGLEMDLSAIWAEKHFEVANYVALSSHFSFPTVNIMHLHKWNSLSDEDKQIIAEAAWEAIDENMGLLRDIDEKMLNNIKGEGVDVRVIEDLGPFIEETKSVYEKYTSRDPRVERFVNKVLEIKSK